MSPIYNKPYAKTFRVFGTSSFGSTSPIIYFNLLSNALFIITCFGSVIVKAQTTNLEKYIQQGLQQNLQIQKNDLAIEKQTYKIKEAKANRLPVVSFDPSYILAAGGRRLEFSVGDLFNPAYQALNELTQSNDFPTDLTNVDEQLTPTNFHDTRVYAAFPLYNKAIYYNLKAQEQLISVEQAKINAFEVKGDG